MQLTIQIFDEGKWTDAAIVTAFQTESGGVNAATQFEYDILYAFGEIRQPVAIHYPVSATLTKLENWPAFLYDLIPQGNGRKYLLGQLNMNDGPAADFHLLRAGAFNPIGRIRVKEAHQYYQDHLNRHDTSMMNEGLSIEQITGKQADFVERMKVHGMLAAGTTGVQGAAPKFLLTQDIFGKWFADGQLEDKQSAKHYIVKLPRGKEDIDVKVLRNEAAYLRTAKTMGLHATVGVELHGNMLFVPRFDRVTFDGKVTRHHQESLASLSGLVGYDRRPTQFELLEAMRNVVTHKTRDTIEFLQRDVLNLAMRNTDNHARNTAVQIINNEIILTPLYDFAPMYLDPEGIARAARWYHPEHGNELNNWADVLKQICWDDNELDQVTAELVQFGHRLNRLPDVMRECGVDEDIIEFLKPNIQNQEQQLRALVVAPGAQLNSVAQKGHHGPA